MKKIIAFILAFMLIVVPLCGCNSFVETGREAVEVRYNITYEDGSVRSEWQTVDKETYEKARDKLPP